MHGAVDAEALDRQIRSTLLAAPSSTLAALLTCAVMMQVLAPAQRVWLGAWVAGFVAVTLLRLAAGWQWRRHACSADRVRRWATPWLASTLLHAAQWGALGVFSLPLAHSPASMAEQALLHITLPGVALGGALRLQGFERLLLLHVLLVLTPITLCDLTAGDLPHLAMAAVQALFGVYAVVQGQAQSRLLREMAMQRTRTQELVEALQREYQRSEAARQHAEELTAARSRFFAAANHDLRQPLHALGLLAESLQSPRSLAEVQQVATHLSECVEGMAQVIDELLDITRLDLGQIATQPVGVRLAAVVEDACRPYRALARLQGLTLELALPDIAVRSDPALLARIVANLVSNAIRYTREGRVVVRAEPVPEALLLHVEDSGIGIAAEHLPRIFDAFYQVGNPARDRRHGLGLGLATVQRLCALLAVPLEVQSTPGQGSRFTLRLPLATEAQHPPEAADATPPRRGGPLQGRRVLVVEDDRDARQALMQLLRSWGCEVQDAVDADAAQALLGSGFRAEALLVDLRLPGRRNGLVFLQELRAASSPPVPALLLTGDADGAERRAAEAAGLPVLLKPARPASLRAFLGQAFAGAPNSAPAAPGPQLRQA